MQKILIVPLAFLILSILACGLPGNTPGPAGDGVTPGAATESETSVSPPAPSLSIAYAKAGNIWLWREGAGSTQLTFSGADSAPSISPDGRVIVFRRGQEMWAVDSSGGSERQLISNAFLAGLVTPGVESVEIGRLAWSPAGHSLFFTTIAIAAEVGYRMPQFDLFLVNADGAPDAAIAYESSGSGGVPYVSPDGNMVAMVQGDRVYTMRITGDPSWQLALTFGPILTYSEWVYVPQLVWKADSSGFFVLVPASDPLGNPAEPSLVWEVPLSGTPTVAQTFLAVPVFEMFPVLAPSGYSSLYLSGTGDTRTVNVFTTGAGNVEYATYALGNTGISAWSPDSTRFLFWGDPANTFYVGQVGQPPIPVGDTPGAMAPRWAGNDRLVYEDAGDLRLWTIGGTSIPIDSIDHLQYDLVIP